MFRRKKNTAKSSNDPRVYAFIGLGMMARFMGQKQLDGLVAALPEQIARACGTPTDNVVVVLGDEWDLDGSGNIINFDGTPASYSNAEQQCQTFLEKRGITDHVVADLQLLGALGDGGGVSMGTLDDLKNSGMEVTGASILITAWLAFPRSALLR